MTGSRTIKELLDDAEKALRAAEAGILAMDTKSKTEHRDDIYKSLDRLGHQVEGALRKRSELSNATTSSIENIDFQHDPTTFHLAVPDPNIRIAALTAASKQKACSDKVVTAIEYCMQNDPVLNVQCTATISLGMCFQNSCNERVCRLLASIVANSDTPLQKRLAAYTGLLIVQNRLLDSAFVDTACTDLSLEIIDWSVVNQFTGDK